MTTTSAEAAAKAVSHNNSKQLEKRHNVSLISRSVALIDAAAADAADADASDACRMSFVECTNVAASSAMLNCATTISNDEQSTSSDKS